MTQLLTMFFAAFLGLDSATQLAVVTATLTAVGTAAWLAVCTYATWQAIR